MKMRKGHSRIIVEVQNEMCDVQMTRCTKRYAGCVIEKSDDKAAVAYSVMGSTVTHTEPMSAEAQTSSEAS